MNIKFCPYCRSYKIKVLKMGKLPGLFYHYAGPKYYFCMKCGFVSNVFPEKRYCRQNKS